MRVLLSTDGSEAAMAAIKTVEQLAERNPIDVTVVTVSYVSDSVASRAECSVRLDEDTHLDVVSVAEQPYVYVGEGFAGPPITLGPEQIRPIEETGERMASQIAKHHHQTQPHTPAAAHVGEAVVRQAEATKANLILVGDTGHSMLGELILGRTSMYVLRHAPCSVQSSRYHTKATDNATPQDETAEVGDAVATS